MKRERLTFAAAVIVTLVASQVALAQGPASATKLRVLPPTEAVPTADVAVLPIGVTLAPGMRQQFTAVISGTANQQVTWSSTGGHIGSDGIFTAVVSSGTYEVTATITGGTIFRSVYVTVSGSPVVTIEPGQDIQAIVSAQPDGAAFLLKAGVHRLQTISPKSGQIFAGETGAILSGARLLTLFSRAGSAWVASEQTQQGAPAGTEADGICRAGSPQCGHPEDLFINDVPLQAVSSVSAGGPGKWYFDYTADQIYFWDDPAGKTVETSVMANAFVGNASDVTIRGLIVEKYATPTFEGAVRLGPEWGAGWIIEDSEVRWNHFAGIRNNPHSIARRNNVHHNGGFGFVGAGDNVLVEGNQISYNNYAGYNPFWGAGGSKWVYTKHLVVRGNFSHHNLGVGLWTDINNIDTLYEDNVVEDNERGGIFHEISYEATIRNNTLRRNGTGKAFPYWTTGAGIEIVSSRNVEVYGNRLEDNWQGITGLEEHRGIGNDGPYALTGLNVHDNIVTSRVTDQGAGRTGVVDSEGTGIVAEANNRFQQNTYQLGTNAHYFVWAGADRTQAEWQGFGQDETGTFSAAKQLSDGSVSPQGLAKPRAMISPVMPLRSYWTLLFRFNSALFVVLTAGAIGSAAGTDSTTGSVAGTTASGIAGATSTTTQPVVISPGDAIQAIVESHPAGTAFLLKPGVHRLHSMTPKNAQTFTGETGAILSGARLLKSFSRRGRAWVVEGQTQAGAVRAATDGVCRSGHPRCGYPEDLFINDLPLLHVDSLGAGGPGTWYFDYAADQIYFWDDPTGKVVETSVTPIAFGGGAHDVTIRNLVIEKYAVPTQTAAAVALGTGWLIEDSEVRLNHYAGIENGPDSTARRNKVHHNGCVGFSGAGENLLVEHNEISHNGYAGYNPFWGAGGAKWVYTTNLVARANFSHHNLGPGLWTDVNNIHTLYEDNIVEDNERGGIFHEISYDAIVRNNAVRRNGSGRQYPYWTTGAGIEIVSSRNVEVYGNRLEDNWQGITGLDDHRGVGTHGAWSLIGLDVHDNIVVSRVVKPGAGRTGLIDTDGRGAFSASANNRFRRNRYVLGTNARYFMWMGTDRTEAEWRVLGHDASGTFGR